MTNEVTINLITVRPDGAHVLVLVEAGPWEPGALDSQLRKLQERLYNAVDVAVDGFLASKYPASKGGPVIIRLDCYDVPRRPVEAFFLRFSDHIKGSIEVLADIHRKGFVSSVDFEFNWRRA